MNKSPALMKRILDSGALSIWNRDKGPVIWYVIGQPGPFYLNTELTIGRDLAERLLTEITAILAAHKDAATRAAQIETLIRDACKNNEAYRQTIDMLIEPVQKDFPAGSYDFISGGERRDWLFSIPLADKLGIPHVYLFKDQSLYCDQAVPKAARALHVADLINNAASYFENWIPILTQNNLQFAGTFTVISRGDKGVKLLADAGHKVSAAAPVDITFFDACLEQHLIDQAMRDEIALFFTSGKDWASRYLMDKPELFHVDSLDAKSRERLTSFFTKDPWGLGASHAEFFAKMRTA